MRGEVEALEPGTEAPGRAKLMAGMFLGLWAGVILFGRLIMYA